MTDDERQEELPLETATAETTEPAAETPAETAETVETADPQAEAQLDAQIAAVTSPEQQQTEAASAAD
jgi:hypothetical protein